MVFFICDACGDCIKKQQTEKHRGQCRNWHAYSCMDCNKVFGGNDYKAHTKCISEEQKYSGKNYQPKENKGEVKQNQWFEQVQRAINNTNPKDNRLKELLNKLLDYPNIPRKQAKFENFLLNSLRIRQKDLTHGAWKAISSAAIQEKASELPKKVESQSPVINGQAENGVKRKLEKGEEEIIDSKKQRIDTDDKEEKGTTDEIFKWKSTIKRLLKEAPENKMKIKKLRQRAVKTYKEGNDTIGESDEGLKMKFMSKLESMNRVKIDGKDAILTI